MRRLVLVRHASTDAVRRAAFGGDEPLDSGGRAAAAGLRAVLPRSGESYSSPALRARQTAAEAGHEGAILEPALAECDFGRWAGRALSEVHAEEPEATGAWMTDPDAAPHGGESLTALIARVGSWLAGEGERDGSAIAFTHGGVVKAAVLRALDAPALAFWRIDSAPVGMTELHGREGRWTVVRLNERPSGT